MPAGADARDTIPVEVAYARPDEQRVIQLEVPEGTSAIQAVELSGIRQFFPEIPAEGIKLGIFGKLKKPEQVLAAGDRVEIYRPLIADPKEVRRKRAAQGKRTGKGGGDL
ncbi:MAG TPA: RnfH family protein [Gammaproteobacteria bacterium]|nr:RnfH family protein [Gammaproteobacteria bacterium]